MAMSKPLMSEIKVICDLCESDPEVKWFCPECDFKMCERCTGCHSRIPSCSCHQVFSFDDDCKSKVKTKAIPKTQKNVVCEICNESNCKGCPADDNETNAAQIAKFNQEKTALLLKALQELQVVKTAMQTLQQRQVDYSATVNKQIEAVKSRADEMRQELEDEKTTLINGLRQEQMRARQIMNAQTARLQNKKNEYQEAVHIRDELERKCQEDENVDPELLDLLQKSQARVDAMEEEGIPPLDLPSFPAVQLSDALSSEQIRETFGTLHHHAPTTITLTAEDCPLTDELLVDELINRRKTLDSSVKQ